MSITSSELKRQNRSNIFREIYNGKAVSKNDLAKRLNLSMPTVTGALEELIRQRLVVREGLFDSTGGRPASIYRCNSNSKIALGVEILKDRTSIVALNLYGNVVDSDTLEQLFSIDDIYFKELGSFVNSFADRCRTRFGEVLGVGISLPAIMDNESGKIVYSELLSTSDFTVDDLTRFVKLPCICRHDAESGAFAEIWHKKLTNDSIIIFLNNYLCNALVIDGKVHVSRNLSCGTVEHLVIHENGKKCYCSKCGCADAYCSALSLLERSGSDSLKSFFNAVEANDPQAMKTWDEYLDDLALTIDNARMVIPCDIIISGLLLPFIRDQDIETLKEKTRQKSTFGQVDFNIRKGECDTNPVMTGSALSIISNYLDSL